MDPARVEGLAKVLADTARTRQIIVFTHDDRLPEAVRRRGIPARVLNVSRRAKSIVDVLRTVDPVSTLLDDARAVGTRLRWRVCRSQELHAAPRPRGDPTSARPLAEGRRLRSGGAFKCCKAGAHQAHEGDLKDLIRDTERLAGHIAGMQ